MIGKLFKSVEKDKFLIKIEVESDRVAEILSGLNKLGIEIEADPEIAPTDIQNESNYIYTIKHKNPDIIKYVYSRQYQDGDEPIGWIDENGEIHLFPHLRRL